MDWNHPNRAILQHNLTQIIHNYAETEENQISWFNLEDR